MEPLSIDINIYAQNKTQHIIWIAKECIPNKIVKINSSKKGKRKVKGVAQSQTAALPRHQEEKETDKTKQTQIEQTYEKHKISSLFPIEAIAMLKGLKTQ